MANINLESNVSVIDRDRTIAPNADTGPVDGIDGTFIVPNGQVEYSAIEDFDGGMRGILKNTYDNHVFQDGFIQDDIWYSSGHALRYQNEDNVDIDRTIGYIEPSSWPDDILSASVIYQPRFDTSKSQAVSFGDGGDQDAFWRQVVFDTTNGGEILFELNRPNSSNTFTVADSISLYDWHMISILYHNSESYTIRVRNLNKDEIVWSTTRENERSSSTYPTRFLYKTFSSKNVHGVIDNWVINENPWHGHEDEIAISKNGRAWDYAQPTTGQVVYVNKEDKAVAYDAQDGWRLVDSGRDEGEHLKYNTDWNRGDLDPGLTSTNDTLKIDV